MYIFGKFVSNAYNIIHFVFTVGCDGTYVMKLEALAKMLAIAPGVVSNVKQMH